MNLSNNGFCVLIARGVPRFSIPQFGKGWGFGVYDQFTRPLPGFVQIAWSINSLIEPKGNKEGIWT